ncbi:hypothetical protein P3S68_017511 [Capsicum galapagoense]
MENIPFALIREEKKKEVVGVVSKKDFFVTTRSRNPNRIYKESYGDIICKIAEIEKIQTQEREDDTDSVDTFASIMGPENPGFVRSYGRGVTKTTLKEKVGDLASSDDLQQQKMEEIEERMKQRMLKKFEEQKDTMKQQIAINIIAIL